MLQDMMNRLSVQKDFSLVQHWYRAKVIVKHWIFKCFLGVFRAHVQVCLNEQLRVLHETKYIGKKLKLAMRWKLVVSMVEYIY